MLKCGCYGQIKNVNDNFYYFQKIFLGDKKMVKDNLYQMSTFPLNTPYQNFYYKELSNVCCNRKNIPEEPP